MPRATRACSRGAYAAIISSFITNPPAATTTAPARTAPVSAYLFQVAPTTRPPLHDQRRHAGVVADLDAETGALLERPLDHETTAADVADERGLVPAGRRAGELAERVGLLAAGVHQPLGARLHHGLGGVVAALELEAEALEPVEVVDRVLAVEPDLRRVRVGAGGEEVLLHLLRAVLVAGGLLHRGPAAEVEVAARHRRGARAGAAPVEQQHARAGPGRLDGRTGAGHARADDEHVDVVGPGGHGTGGHGGRDLDTHAAHSRTRSTSWRGAGPCRRSRTLARWLETAGPSQPTAQATCHVLHRRDRRPPASRRGARERWRPAWIHSSTACLAEQDASLPSRREPGPDMPASRRPRCVGSSPVASSSRSTVAST